ncbi:MAG: DUF6449 domain-containing protein [Bacillota bacterium]|nr:DUF6449 domain-containing protein [Bacillota bacterium]
MNSKKSFSDISLPLIVENIKRFWLGSVFALFGYLCVCCLPLALTGKSSGLISGILSPSYLPVAGLTLVVPVFAALLIYRYMQQQSSAAIVHALPYSRKQLFHSSFISGIILCLAPVVVTGIIFMLTSIIGGPVTELIFDPSTGFEEYNVFSIKAILIWTGIICLMNTVVFTIALFSAVLTGSTLIQGILSLVLIFIFPVIIAMTNSLAAEMLYGYSSPGWIQTMCGYTSPIIGMAMQPGPGSYICYGCAALVIYVISYYLYKNRNMERASDTLIFDISKPVVKYVLTYAGMCCFALFLKSLYDGEGKGIIYIGAAAGALVAYVAVDMLIQKRIRIKGFAKGFVIYAAAAVVFFGLFAFDIFGYESRIPDIDDIKGISIGGITDGLYIESACEGGFDRCLIEDPEVIAEVQKMHRDIIEEKENFFPNLNRYYTKYSGTETHSYLESYVTLKYELKNGKTVNREYSVPSEWLYENESVRKTVESKAYKEKAFPVISWKDGEKEISSVLINTVYEADLCGKVSSNITEKAKADQLRKAVSEDIHNLKYDQMNINGIGSRILFSMEFRIKNTERLISEELNRQYYEQYGYYYNDEFLYYGIEVNTAFTKTMELLKEWGIYDSLVIIPEDISYITVSYINVDTESEFGEETSEKDVDVYDKETIGRVLDTASSGYIHDGDHYEITFHPANDRTGECFYLYYDTDSVPEFVKEALK